MADRFNLGRFVTAQDAVMDGVRQELKACQKRSHWMWFIFPQIAGLGLSPMSQKYAISGLEEAKAYLEQPLLGARLLECAGLVVNVPGRTAEQIFGPIDAAKFRSCMTLFARASGEPIFDDALAKYFDNTPDPETIKRL